jgi:hypothetical protein
MKHESNHSMDITRTKKKRKKKNPFIVVGLGVMAISSPSKATQRNFLV